MLIILISYLTTIFRRIMNIMFIGSAGQDGQEAGDGKVSWDFDGKTAVLEETETGCLINISIGEKAQ